MPERSDHAGAVLSYRCLVLFRAADCERQPIVKTLDVGAKSLRELSMIETQASRAAIDLFSMVSGVVDLTPHDSD